MSSKKDSLFIILLIIASVAIFSNCTNRIINIAVPKYIQNVKLIDSDLSTDLEINMVRIAQIVAQRIK